MKDELEANGLLIESPWVAGFQITFNQRWHHQGGRARHGAMMARPVWVRWRGLFELQQDMDRLEQIHDRRGETGKIESVGLQAPTQSAAAWLPRGPQ